MVPVGQVFETCAISCGGIGTPVPANIPLPAAESDRRPTCGGGRRRCPAGRWNSRRTGTPDGSAPHWHSFYGQFERRPGAHGFHLERSVFHIFTGYRPAVFPKQWSDIENAGSAAVQVSFPMY